MTDFKIEYYDSGSSTWKEVSDWIDLSIKYPNGFVQLAPTAQFTTDKDTTFSAHQKIRIHSIASDGTTTKRFEGFTKSKGTINPNGNRDLEVRGYGYEMMKKSISINLSSTDTISVLEEAVSGTSYTIDSSNATSKSMNSYLINDGKIQDVFTDIMSEGGYIYRIAHDQTIYVEDINGRGEYSSIDVQSDPAVITQWEEGHIDTVVNKVIGNSVVEHRDTKEWSNDLGEKQFSIDRKGDKLYVSGVDEIRCLDIDDGSVLWTESNLASGNNIKALSIEGDLMVIGTDGGSVKLYEIGSSGLTLLDSHTEHGSNNITRVLFKDGIALSLGYDENLVYATYSSSDDTLTVQDFISVAGFGLREATGLAMRDNEIIASINAYIYVFEYDEGAGTLSETTKKNIGSHEDVQVYDNVIFVCYGTNVGICTLRDGRLELITKLSLDNDAISIDIDNNMVAVGHEDSGDISYLEYDPDPKSLTKIFETDVHGGTAENNLYDILIYDNMIYSPSQQNTVYSYYASEWKKLSITKENTSSINNYGERSEKYNFDFPQTTQDLEDAVSSRLQPEPEPKGKLVMGSSLYSAGDIVNNYVTLTDDSMNVSGVQMTIDEQTVTPQTVGVTLGGTGVAGAKRTDFDYRSKEDIDRISYETINRLGDYNTKTTPSDLSHDDLSDITSDDHHTKTTLSGLAHNDLSGISSDDHHVKTTASGLAHNNLSGISSDDHHSKTTASELNHNDLSSISSGDHHSKTTASELNHNDLSSISSGDHHSKTTDYKNLNNRGHDLGGGDHNSDTLSDLNSKISDATLDDTGDSRTPTSHNLGGGKHNTDTLSDLNSKISDATLDGKTNSRPPNRAIKYDGTDYNKVNGASGIVQTVDTDFRDCTIVARVEYQFYGNGGEIELLDNSGTVVDLYSSSSFESGTYKLTHDYSGDISAFQTPQHKIKLTANSASVNDEVKITNTKWYIKPT